MSLDAVPASIQIQPPKTNQVGTVMLYGVPIVSLMMDGTERLCLAQISNTLLKDYSYNEIHNRRVALGITCIQCTPVQLEMLRRAGAMPVSSRRCGMITRREAERLCKSFLGDNSPPRLPEDFAFAVHHDCAWGCAGAFIPARYNSSRAKCIKCSSCGLFFSPNKFIFHSHRSSPTCKYVQPDAANFNSWRRHMKLSGTPPDGIIHAWEDVKAMFNGGTRKRLLGSCPKNPNTTSRSSKKIEITATPRVPPLPIVPPDWWKVSPYPLAWPIATPWKPYPSAFTPVYPPLSTTLGPLPQSIEKDDDTDEEETVDVETCHEEEEETKVWTPPNLTKSAPTNIKEDSSRNSPDHSERRKNETFTNTSNDQPRDLSFWRYHPNHNSTPRLRLIRDLVTTNDVNASFQPLEFNHNTEKIILPLDCTTCQQLSYSPPVVLPPAETNNN